MCNAQLEREVALLLGYLESSRREHPAGDNLPENFRDSCGIFALFNQFAGKHDSYG
jgi:hypothetical protein